ncbi:hypothetical protein SpCBS45565_g03427 [Spizellomyces sp. 'palustris']|nr:hypothetical protein SpCBS45565_g03427 [Spizellomyces sp. 'palustris']
MKTKTSKPNGKLKAAQKASVQSDSDGYSDVGVEDELANEHTLLEENGAVTDSDDGQDSSVGDNDVEGSSDGSQDGMDQDANNDQDLSGGSDQEQEVTEGTRGRKSFLPRACFDMYHSSAKWLNVEHRLNHSDPMHSTSLSASGTTGVSIPVTPAVEELVKKDVGEFVTLLSDFKAKVVELRARLAVTLDGMQSGTIRTSNGVSLLEVKVHSILSYLTNLAFYLLLKLHGHSPQNHEAISNLVELRIVLEKIKPLEQKLKYQIDKLVKAATMHEDQQNVAGPVSALQDPLAFKPNPAAMVSSATIDTTGGQDETGGVYRPPKLAPMHFDEQGSRTKTGRLTQAAKEKASRSRLLRDLRSQYDDRPEEMTAEGTGYGAHEVSASKQDEKWAERERFEEENFIRLNMTREDKRMAANLRKKGALMRFQDEFQALEEDFRDLSGLQRAVQDEDELRYGKGVIQKQNRRAAEYGTDRQGRKRKFNNAGEMISDVAKIERTRGGADEFGKEVKKRKRALAKKK